VFNLISATLEHDHASERGFHERCHSTGHQKYATDIFQALKRLGMTCDINRVLVHTIIWNLPYIFARFGI
jgi:hypothetical protein